MKVLRGALNSCAPVSSNAIQPDQKGTQVTKTLFILNAPPYGTERSYNGMRLVNALSKGDNDEVRVFLLADAVACARRGQKTPDGYYNVARMLRVAVRQGVLVGT